MTCPICKNGETKNGFTTVTLERNEKVIVFRNVPANICENCGEYYLNETTSVKLYNQAEVALKNGAVFELCDLNVA
jgi:YgiT-type zinc finger domain-containing protein